MAARTKVFVDIVTKSNGKEPGTGLKKFAVGAGIATAAFVVLAKAATEFSKAASDAEEISSKFATIFRDISKEAEGVADSFAENFGLAGSTARELLGNTADLLTGLGFTQEGALDLSEQVNTLAADLASFSNFAGGTTGASEALTKALLGEAESAKALGIVINQNTKEYKDAIKFYTEVEGKTLLQAKAFTALQFATEQSGNAIGDVSRTWESHANVQRRLQESTKSFKEEMGAFVNQAATPLLAITDRIVKKMADWLEKLNDTRDILQLLEGDGVDASVSLETLENTLEVLVKQQEQLGRGGSQQLRDQTAAVQALIDNYDHVHDRINANAQAESIYTNIVLERARAIQEVADIEAAADEALKQLRLDALTDEEKKLALLQEQIDHWAELRTQGADVQELLNVLIAQRNALLEDGNVELEKEIENYEELFPILGGIASDFGTVGEAVVIVSDAVKELTMDYENMAETAATAFASTFKEVGEGNKTLWEGVKDGAKDAISAILESYAQLWLAQAAASFVALNFIAGAGYTAAAAGAFAASGAVQSFATGGQFITDGPALIGDNASGQERVTVEPLGGGGGGASNNTGQIMILRIGDRDLKAVVQGWINNRGLHSSRGGAI